MSNYPPDYLAIRGDVLQVDEAVPTPEKRLRDAIEVDWARREARRFNDEREAPPAPPISFQPGTAFIERDLGPEFPIVVEKLARAGHNVGMAAQFKTGKTTFHANLARSMVEGSPFLGKLEVPHPQRVAYLNAELTEADMQDLMKAVGIHPAARARLTIANRRGMLPRLTIQARRSELVKSLLDVGAEALIIDCLRPLAAAAGLNENTNAEIGALLAWLDEIKVEAGVSTLWLIHHTGRAPQVEGMEHARGATAFDDWADMRILLTRDDQGRRYVRSEGRMEGLEEQSLRFDPETRRISLAGHSRKQARKNDLSERVVAAVTANPGISAGVLYKELGVNRDDAVDAVNLTQTQNLIHRHPGPKRAQFHYTGPFVPGLDGSCQCSVVPSRPESSRRIGDDSE